MLFYLCIEGAADSDPKWSFSTKRAPKQTVRCRSRAARKAYHRDTLRRGVVYGVVNGRQFCAIITSNPATGSPWLFAHRETVDS